MKYYKSLLPIFCIAFIFAYQSKKDFSEAFIQVAETGNPAVVSIVSEKIMKQNHHQFFDPFGGKFPRDEFKGHTLGSGVIIDADAGYIVTNNHVIEDADEIKVVMFDKREVEAEIVATDPPSDLAVIKVKPSELYTVKLGDSDKLSVGEWVVAIGSPFGLHLNHTVTAGIVSAVGRSSVMSRNNFEDFIQHDAAINPGNSGGALFNLDGELIGINSAIATDGFSRANAGVGFAIPINRVKDVAKDLKKFGKVERSYTTGIHVQSIDPVMQRYLRLPSSEGVIITDVEKRSSGEKTGLKIGDVILAVDGEKINSANDIIRVIDEGLHKVGDIIMLKILRENHSLELQLTLEEPKSQWWGF